MGNGHWELGIGNERDSFHAPCPMPHAPCPMPHALCPMPHALCPMPYAQIKTILLVRGFQLTVSHGDRLRLIVRL
jgi:hypothetical protein